MKRDLLLVLATGAIVFLVAQNTSPKPFQEESPKILRCNGLEVVDRDGRPRIKLFVTEKGDAEIRLVGGDPKMSPTIYLQAGSLTSAISLSAPKGNKMVTITNAPWSSAFQISTTAEDAERLVEIGVLAETGSFLSICKPSNRTEFNVWGDEQGRVSFRMGGPGKNSALEFSADGDKTPTITATNKTGSRVWSMPAPAK